MGVADDLITERHGYAAMFLFLLEWWRRGRVPSEDVEWILSALDLRTWSDDRPSDPAMEQDWHQAVDPDPRWVRSVCRRVRAYETSERRLTMRKTPGRLRADLTSSAAPVPEPPRGLEPRTPSLRVKCSTS